MNREDSVPLPPRPLSAVRRYPGQRRGPRACPRSNRSLTQLSRYPKVHLSISKSRWLSVGCFSPNASYETLSVALFIPYACKGVTLEHQESKIESSWGTSKEQKKKERPRTKVELLGCPKPTSPRLHSQRREYQYFVFP